MHNSFKVHLCDHSTSDIFHFSLQCPECGAELKSTPAHFSKSGTDITAGEDSSLLSALYRQEKIIALENAAAEIKLLVNLCPICRRLVCDHCFVISDTIDMCISCAQRLGVHGEHVLI